MMKKIEIPKVSMTDIKIWLDSVDRKTLIQNATFVGAFLAFVILFLIPMVLYNGKITSQVSSLKSNVTQTNVKIMRIPEMSKQKELFGTRTKKIRSQFFKSEEADKLFGIISNLAGESGVKISASRPAQRLLALPEPFSRNYTTVSYELILEGGYHQVGSFVNRLEEYEKNFSVHELQITGADKNVNTQEATLVVVAFLEQAK